MNWKGFGRKLPWPPSLTWKDKRTPKKETNIFGDIG
jgi:hypothetical protein